MGSSQLEKLEKLAGQRADASGLASRKQRDSLMLLEQQDNELSRIHQEYQTGIVGRSDVSPQLLAHRRAFVSRLSAKMEDLKQQKQQQKERLRQSAAEHLRHQSQRAALDLMAARQRSQDLRQQIKQEARQQNDFVQSQWHGAMNRRNDNV